MPQEAQIYWAKTVGAPRPGDRRDGELHRMSGATVSRHLDLEPWEDDPHGEDARYVLAADQPVIDPDGREVWTYTYVESPEWQLDRRLG